MLLFCFSFHWLSMKQKRDADGLCDNFRDVPWEFIFKLGLLLLLVNFRSGLRLELMYISFIVNIRSSLTGLHGFQLRLYQQNKSSKSKAKFRQTSNYCKWVFEAASVTYASKKEPITSQKLGFRDVWRIADSVLNSVNLLYLPYSTARSFCLLHLIKQNCLLKTFLGTLLRMTQVSLCLFSLLELIWNCINFCNPQVG